jgi:hypothetical protein
MGLPVAMFAIPRRVGWLAQWQEIVTDPEQKITRPPQIFVGHSRRELPTWQWARLEVRRRKENEPLFAETCVIAASRHEQSCLDFNACYETKYFACYPNSDRRRRRPKC